MAEIYEKVNGKPIQEYLARRDDVQLTLRSYTFEIAARASVLLLEHRYEGHARIETNHWDVDHYVVLSDERGQKAAMTIEFGREAHTDPKTGRRVGAMEGLFILHRAAGVPIRSRPKVKGKP